MNEQAVVLGGSMAGMLAARVLADRYEQVTVIERDRFVAGVRHRRGVPQGHHFHTVLRRGAEILDQLFPGLVDDLTEAGAHRTNLLREARLVLSGHEFCRADTGNTVQLTRPLLETSVRDRLAATPNVKIVDGCEAVGPHTESGRVTGIHVAHRGGHGEFLPADLVVDAMGRAGRTATWLSELGLPTPPEERITADIAYVSRLVRIPAVVRPADRMVLVGPIPGRPTGFALAAQEDDRWMLTAVGVAGDHPPTSDAGLLEFVARSAPHDILAAIEAAEPLTEPHRHRFPASIWRHYERLRDFPSGLLVFGDAICSFNPIYGQGMTVAALEADALRQCLLTGGADDLAYRFFRAAAKIIAPAWRLGAGGDLRLPEVDGHRPLAMRLINKYVGRLQRVAAHDPVVAGTFMRVAGLRQNPAALLAPHIMARVARG